MSDQEPPHDTSGDISSEFGEPLPVSYNTRDLIIYALGIGCTELKYVYEDDMDFAAFPTYPIVLAFKGTDTDVLTFPSPAMATQDMVMLPGFKTVLDGERYIEMVNPLPTEPTELFLKSKNIGVHKKGKGGLVESESILVDGSGKVYYRFISGAFYVGAKGFTDSGVTHSASITPPQRAPDAVEEQATGPFQTHLYRLSGDYNPLHIDPDMAVGMGFKEPILHGLCSLGHAARACLSAFGDNDPANFKALKLRFASPVLPGQTLVTSMWKDGPKVIFETKVKETGKVVINNAFSSSRLAPSCKTVSKYQRSKIKDSNNK